MRPKRLVLFVEAEGDKKALPILVQKVLRELSPWAYLFLDPQPLLVHGIQYITGRKIEDWSRFLRVAAKRPDLGGVLLVLDGDAKSVIREDTGKKEPFCAAEVARRLAAKARDAGGGRAFSVACVFACREYESWLLAGAESLRGRSLPDGRAGVKPDAPPPIEDTDTHPRDAKGWFNRNMPRGYRPTTDQALLTEMVDLGVIRGRDAVIPSFGACCLRIVRSDPDGQAYPQPANLRLR